MRVSACSPMGLRLLAIIFFLHPLLPYVVRPVAALNIGVHSSNSGIFLSEECSRTCESAHCSVPPFLRYGKYCGILYTGCPGEEPCDGLDACCQIHDACIEAKNDDYLNEECNENLLDCVSEFRDSGAPSFPGSNCEPDEVVDVISVVIQAALLAGRAIHKKP